MRMESDTRRLDLLRRYFLAEKIEELIDYRSKGRYVGEELDLLQEIIQEKIDAEDGVTFQQAAEAPVTTPAVPAPSQASLTASNTTAEIAALEKAQEKPKPPALAVPSNPVREDGTPVQGFVGKVAGVKFSNPGRIGHLQHIAASHDLPND